MKTNTAVVFLWGMVLLFVGVMVYLTGDNNWAWLLVVLLFVGESKRA